ncbi:MAG: hypothetical protein DRH26_11260 [Deltaproteobacteria bacterium]|nr:MAG: hypothetical protein DRH26_11260 [Deltaproteobacteria bacterium]
MYLPLTNNPEENFTASIDDIIYNFRQLWNGLGFWTLDIKDADGVAFVDGVKIITQEYLLRQYPHIPFDLRSDNEVDPGRQDLESFLLDISDKDV